MVPEEVAVMGVDNDEIVCRLCGPSLSTIELDPHRVGYEAAALLDTWMANPRKTPPARMIAPKGLVVRQSTDVIAVSDTDVASAVKFIREHACDGINVSTVLDHVPVSRSTLERRFHRILNRSPKDEIDRVQLAQVKRLLAQTDYPLSKIASLAGFRYTEGMCHLFRNTFGQTPGEYRHAQRKRG
jgi:LacI family transcriptional regulator